ncbi:hypothetical protein IQ07DRAFT_649707 [Pyrenochaeta sp. DS3sAY3a]|nr:hypothetical protein IQ07DRAFT_649707 [Pyrenochaeta sp. DS3sAY3a]
MDQAPVDRTDIKDLWARAEKKLSDADKRYVTVHSQDKNDVVAKLLQDTENWRKKATIFPWRITRKGENIIFSRLFQRLTQWLVKFAKIGDIAVQCDAGHAALPWALVRLVLQVLVLDWESLTAIEQGLPHVAELICLYKLVERRYRQGTSDAVKELERALCKLYISILTFLDMARQYCAASTTRRMLKALTYESDFAEALVNINKEEVSVAKCQVLVDAENAHIEGEKASAERNASVAERIVRSRDHLVLRKLLEDLGNSTKITNDKVQSLREDVNAMQREKEKNEILEWFSKQPYNSHHLEAQKKVLKGTGKWLLLDPTFVKWRDNCASSIFWLHGSPGFGKTALTSIVISEALEKVPADPDSPTVFFYCSRESDENQIRKDPRSKPEVILATLARQLSLVDDGVSLLEPAITFYQKYRRGEGYNPGELVFQDSVNLIEQLLKKYSSATIVIDGIDECDAERRRSLIQDLKTIMRSSTNTVVKIFISSRSEHDIDQELKECTNIEVNSTRNGTDLSMFIKKKTKDMIRNGELLHRSTRRTEMQDYIIAKLIDGATGMFRWAEMQLKYLKLSTDDDDMKKKLLDLPRDLYKSYQRIYDDISNASNASNSKHDKAKLSNQAHMFQNILYWLLCAQRTLPSSELLALISVNTSTGQDLKASRDHVLELCSGFIEYDSELDNFRFAHLSVREFLEQKPGLNSSKTNALAAEICLWNILSLNATLKVTIQNSRQAWEEDVTLAHQKQPNPALEYSDLYWATHCKLAGRDGRSQGPLRAALPDFLSGRGGKSAAINQWISRVEEHMDRTDDYGDMWFFDLELEYPSELRDAIATGGNATAAGLFISATFDFDEIIPMLIYETKWESACINNQGRGLLEVAIRNGNIATLQKLFEAMGPELLISEVEIEAAAATAEHSKEIMSMLLKFNVSITEWALEAAAGNRYDNGATLELLLDHPDLDHPITEAVLKAAAKNWRGGKAAMAVMLNKRGSEVRITEAVLEATRHNYGEEKHIIALFIDQPDVRLQVTEALLATAAEKLDLERLNRLLRRIDKEKLDVQVTEAVLKSAARNNHHAHEVLPRLLYRFDELPISETVMVEAAKNKKIDKEQMALLRDERDARDANSVGFLAESVLVAAAENICHGVEILELLFDDAASSITEPILAAAARNIQGKSILTFLFERCSSRAPITETVLEAAICNDSDAEDVLKMLIDKIDNDGSALVVTESLIKAVGSTNHEHSYQTNRILEILLKREGGHIFLTDTIVGMAARQKHDGLGVLRTLIEQLWPRTPLTKELIESLLSHFGDQGLNLLLSKRAADLAADESLVKTIIAQCGPRSLLEILSHQNRPFSSALMSMIAARFDHDIIKHILDRPHARLTITKEVLKQAAKHQITGTEVMQLLLEQPGADSMVEEEVLQAATENEHVGPEVVSLILRKSKSSVPITEAILLSAVKNGRQCLGILKILTIPRRPSPITDKVLENAARYQNMDVMHLLLRKCATSMPIASFVVVAAASSSKHGRGLMTFFCEKPKSKVPITAEVVVAAAQNEGSGKDVLEIIFDLRKEDVHITAEMFEAAARNRQNGKDMIMLLIDKCGSEVPIKKHTFFCAVQNSSQGKDILECLFESKPTDCPTLQELVSYIEAHRHASSRRIIQFLLERTSVPIPEATVLAICKGFAEDVVRYMLRKCGKTIAFTPAVLVAITKKFNHKIMRHLLEESGPSIHLTEQVVLAASDNYSSGEKVLRLLLSSSKAIVHADDKVLAAITRSFDVEILQCLLCRCGKTIPITEFVLTSIAKNSKNGTQKMKALIKHYGSDLRASDATLTLIAKFFPKEVMELFLEQAEIHPSITESVIKAASENRRHGKNILMCLLNHKGILVAATSSIHALIATNFDEDVMDLLLHQPGDRLFVSNTVIEGAAGNREHGNEVMKLLIFNWDRHELNSVSILGSIVGGFDQEVLQCLLGKLGRAFRLSHELIKAAAFNWNYGEKVLTLLLEQCEPKPSVTPELLEELVKGSSPNILRLLLDESAGSSITPSVLEAAAKNQRQGADIMRLLLDLIEEVTNERALIKLAAQNFWGGKEIVEAIMGKGISISAITQELFEEVAAGSYRRNTRAIMTLFLELGVDVSMTERLARTVARRREDSEEVMSFLLDGCSPAAKMTTQTLATIARMVTPNIMQRLLKRHSVDGLIGQAVICAAARNPNEEVLRLLLRKRASLRKETISFTDGTLISILKEIDEKSVTVLIDEIPEHISVTEDIVQAIAKNTQERNQIMRAMIHPPKSKPKVTDAMVTTIAERFDSDILLAVLEPYKDCEQITEKAILTVARRFDEKSMQSVLERRKHIVLSAELVLEAVGERSSPGPGMLKFLLRQTGARMCVTGTALIRIISSVDSDTLQRLLKENKNIKMTDEILVTMARHHDAKSLECFLVQSEVKYSITRSLILEALENRHNDEEGIRALLDRCSTNIQMNEAMVRDLGRYGENANTIMTLLLSHSNISIPATPQMLEAVMSHFDAAVLQRLLDTLPGTKITITSNLSYAAVRNSRHGKEVMNYLLGAGCDRIIITVSEREVEEVVERFDAELVQKLLDKCSQRKMLVSERHFNAAARNNKHKAELVMILLQHGNTITEMTSPTVAKVATFHTDMTRILLRQPGAEHIQIDEQIVCAAIKNHDHGEDILTLLFEGCTAYFSITQSMIQSATERQDGGENIMKLLLQSDSPEIQLDDETVASLAEHYGPEIMQCVMTRLGSDFAITKRLIGSAARNEDSGYETIKLLLENRSAEIVSSEEFVLAMLYTREAKVVYDFLKHYGDDIPITTAVIDCVARYFNKDTLELIFARCGDNISLLKAAVEAGTRSSHYSKEVLDFLHPQPHGAVVFRNALEAAAASEDYYCGQTVMTTLLKHFQPNIPLSANILEVAAANEKYGHRIVQTLLQHTDSKKTYSCITDTVLQSAARNKKRGEKITALLLKPFKKNLDNTESQLMIRPPAPITEAVLLVAVANESDGNNILQRLLSRISSSTPSPLTHAVLLAAAANKIYCDHILKTLLEHPGVASLMSEAVMCTAAENRKYGHDAVEVLLQYEEGVRLVTEEVLVFARNNATRAVREMLEAVRRPA